MNNLTFRAANIAGNLTQTISDAHSMACDDDPMLALLLFDLIADARKIRQRLDEINMIQKTKEAQNGR